MKKKFLGILVIIVGFIFGGVSYFQNLAHEFGHYFIGNYIIGYSGVVNIPKTDFFGDNLNDFNKNLITPVHGGFYSYNSNICYNFWKDKGVCDINLFLIFLLDIAGVVFQVNYLLLILVIVFIFYRKLSFDKNSTISFLFEFLLSFLFISILFAIIFNLLPLSFLQNDGYSFINELNL